MQIANYGKEPIDADINWSITDTSGNKISAGKINNNIPIGKLTDAGYIECSLNNIKKAGKYIFTTQIDGTQYKNQWNLWIYPSYEIKQGNIMVKNRLDDETLDYLQKGGKVLLSASELGDKNTSRPIYFNPLFWSNSFFPGQSCTTLGAYINNQHPALNLFPTDNHTDWQWQTISKGRSFVVNSHPNLEPIVQPISDFHINEKDRKSVV